MNRPPPHPQVPRPWQPKFSIRFLFLVTLVASVMAAIGGYMLKARQSRGSLLAVAFFLVASPVLLMTVVSLGHQLVAWWQRRRVENRNRRAAAERGKDEP